MNLKKSYKSFFLIMLLFIVAVVGIILLPLSASMMVRVLLNYMDLYVVVLMLVIYITERVYWISGITYEQAVEAGSERRKQYAKAHLIDFGIMSLGYLIVSILLQMFHISFYVDLVVYMVVLCGVCFATMRHKM